MQLLLLVVEDLVNLLTNIVGGDLPVSGSPTFKYVFSTLSMLGQGIDENVVGWQTPLFSIAGRERRWPPEGILKAPLLPVFLIHWQSAVLVFAAFLCSPFKTFEHNS